MGEDPFEWVHVKKRIRDSRREIKNYFRECLFKPSKQLLRGLYISELQVKETKTSNSLASKKYHSKLQESWSSETSGNYGQIDGAF